MQKPVKLAMSTVTKASLIAERRSKKPIGEAKQVWRD